MSGLISPTITRTCNGTTFKWLVAAGLAWLEQNHEAVNQLNVFPVPDGDTGTNMMLTMRAAYGQIDVDDSTNVGIILHKLAHGAVMGSRGNSGTILSQLFSGLSKVIGDREEFDGALLASAAREAVRMAYRAVQTPTEGTI